MGNLGELWVGIKVVSLEICETISLPTVFIVALWIFIGRCIELPHQRPQTPTTRSSSSTTTTNLGLPHSSCPTLGWRPTPLKMNNHKSWRAKTMRRPSRHSCVAVNFKAFQSNNAPPPSSAIISSTSPRETLCLVAVLLLLDPLQNIALSIQC